MFPAGGDVGVVFFLMLSGFVMTYGYGARVLEEGFNRQRYLKRRVARVWPLHLVCLLAALTLLPVTLNADTVAALGLNIVLLQSWVPLRDFFFSGNSVSWCLCDLMFFYILFPWLRRLFHRLKGRLIAVLTAAAAALYVAVAVIVPADFRLGVVYVNPLMRLPDFLIGMGLCMLLLHHRQRLPRMSESAATAAQAGVWLLLGLFIALWPFVPPTVQYASLWWIPCGALLMATACGGGPPHAAAEMASVGARRRAQLQLLYDSSAGDTGHAPRSVPLAAGMEHIPLHCGGADGYYIRHMGAP